MCPIQRKKRMEDQRLTEGAYGSVEGTYAQAWRSVSRVIDKPVYPGSARSTLDCQWKVPPEILSSLVMRR